METVMNCSEPTQRVRPRALTAAGMAALLLALVATAWVRAEPGNDNRDPELEGECAKIHVEAGHKVIAHAYAVGVQIYRWTGTSWAFVGPEALLYQGEDEHGEFAIHYAGPTWESESGSKVVATVEERCFPDPDAIPWLRLKASSSEGPGIFDGVTYIQRVNTQGGVAPSEPGDFVGEVVEVPYTAEYYFYRAHQ
jgi:Protein of unknown function (DUF3455)